MFNTNASKPLDTLSLKQSTKNPVNPRTAFTQHTFGTIVRSSFFLVLLSFSLMTEAQADHKRKGPPKKALKACESLKLGDACGFTGRRGELQGTCIEARRDASFIVCAPEGHEHRRRHKKKSERNESEEES